VLRAAQGFKLHGARCIALTASPSTPLAAVLHSTQTIIPES